MNNHWTFAKKGESPVNTYDTSRDAAWMVLGGSRKEIVQKSK